MRKSLIILSLLFSSNLFGQGFTYSYVDPCSKKQKVINITGNQNVTVNYLGFIGSFSQTDFANGTFDNWMANIQVQAANQPCDEMMTQTQTTQNMIITQNIISTLTSITATSTMSVSSVGNSISNSVDNASSNNSPSSRRGSSNRQNNGTNQSNNTSSGTISNGSTTQNGTPNTTGNSGGGSTNGGGNSQNGETTSQNGGNSSGSGVPTQGGSGQTQPSVNNPSSNPSSNPPSNPSSQTGGNGSGGNTQSGTNTPQGQSTPDGTTKPNESGGGNGGTTNSVANAAEASSSSSGNGGGSKVKVGSIIGTGDIVALRSNEDGSNQFKGTMSVTKSNTNNTKAKGFLLNFTTTINNTNLTFYGAFSNKKKTNTLIVANSSMIDFERNFFNTSTIMDSKRFGKLTMMGGLNMTVGSLAGEGFSNLSAIGGGFVPFKASKKLSGNILMLGVYSPFTKFYDGKWWDSGILLVPFSSWDYTISKSFKYNVSISGTYQVKGSVLNYQVLTGAKILL